MISTRHFSKPIRAKLLGLVCTLLATASVMAQPEIAPADVFDNGYRADSCYHRFYKAPGQLDTVAKASGTKVYRIWRVVRIDNSVNKDIFAAPEKGCMKNDLFEVLKYGIRSGRIAAYKGPDLKGPPFSWTELQKTLTVTDSLTESYIGNQGDTITTARGSRHLMHSSELSGYVVCEDWYVDSKGMRRDRRIISICPVYDLADVDKTKPDKPLFYVNYSGCRELLASFRAASDEKGADMSFDEVFVKKKFGSIVVKTENVYTHSFSTYPDNSQDESTLSVQKLLK